MKVYVCYDCCFDGCEYFKAVVKIVDCEEKAMCWKEDNFTPTEWDFREYEEFELE